MPNVSVLTLSDSERWRRYLQKFTTKDFTFFPEYVGIYEKFGEGKAECFVYEDDDGLILFPYIRRPLSKLPFQHDFSGYYDIVTPYCYGGILEENANQRSVLAFRAAFDKHARDTQIISEFIRFHPLTCRAEMWEGAFQKTHLHSHNVVVDLTKSNEEIVQGYRSRLRSYIHATSAAGVRIILDENFKYIEEFFEMYSQNMKRHGQTGYFTFSKEYFKYLAALPKDNVSLYVAVNDNKFLSGAFFIRFGSAIDYFLAASSHEHDGTRPAHLLIHQVILQAKNDGAKILQLGGGAESLYFFKQGFSKETVPYYIGQHIHDDTAYNGLIESWMKANPLLEQNKEYFPLYRSGLE